MKITEQQHSQLDEDIPKLELSLKFSINKYFEDGNKSFRINFESKSHVNNQYSSKGVSLKRPKIPLSVFIGQFEELTTFKNIAKDLINNNYNLKDNDKLFYLRGAMKNKNESLQTSDVTTVNSFFNALEISKRKRFLSTIIQKCFEHVKINPAKILRKIFMM